MTDASQARPASFTDGFSVAKLLLEGRAFFALIVIIIVFSVLSPYYFSLSNFLTMASHVAILNDHAAARRAPVTHDDAHRPEKHGFADPERRRLADEPVTWLTGRCISYGKEMAYLPIIDLLKHNFQVEEGDDDATVSARIERGMEALGAELQLAIPHVKYLLSVPPGDNSVLRLDAQQRRLKLFEALRAMTLQGGQRRPLVLVVEDLHWIDPHRTPEQDHMRHPRHCQ